MRQRLHKAINWLQGHADRPWHGLLISVLAFLDNIVIVIPNDGILISSTILVPRKWFSFAMYVSIGSTIGAVCLAVLAKSYGMPFILEHFPEFTTSTVWQWMDRFFDQYGLLLLALVAFSPLFLQPASIFSAMAGESITSIAIAIFLGRALKFLILAYISSHAPKLLSKFWGLKGELEEVGLDPKAPEKSSLASNS